MKTRKYISLEIYNNWGYIFICVFSYYITEEIPINHCMTSIKAPQDTIWEFIEYCLYTLVFKFILSVESAFLDGITSLIFTKPMFWYSPGEVVFYPSKFERLLGFIGSLEGFLLKLCRLFRYSTISIKRLNLNHGKLLVHNYFLVIWIF